MAEVLAASAASDWQPLDPENTLYLELASGRVVIALAPAFAPRHVASVKTLVRARYFDGLAVLRSQDNYVVQWGDPAQQPEKRRPLGAAAATLPPEFDRPLGDDLPFTPLTDGDAYAPEVGFGGGFPVARDPRGGRMWLTHCYGMVGAGRDEAPGSGSGTELYVVIGHAPRHLDRNVTLLGRVVQGMEHLSTLPRGTGALGFYEDPAQQVPIRSLRLAADLPAEERADLETLRTDSPAFAALIASRRHRSEPWFAHPVDRIELCNVPLPVRPRPRPPASAARCDDMGRPVPVSREPARCQPGGARVWSNGPPFRQGRIPARHSASPEPGARSRAKLLADSARPSHPGAAARSAPRGSRRSAARMPAPLAPGPPGDEAAARSLAWS
jgi:peptidylprolyl isomerase